MRISDWSSDVCSSDLVFLRSLDGVAEGVAEVEQGALAVLERVAFDDRGLVRAAAGDGFGQRVRVAAEQRVRMRGEPVEEGRVDDRDVIDHLRERSDERRVGKECDSTCRSRWARST